MKRPVLNELGTQHHIELAGLVGERIAFHIDTATRNDHRSPYFSLDRTISASDA
jgi:hypothetical protein